MKISQLKSLSRLFGLAGFTEQYIFFWFLHTATGGCDIYSFPVVELYKELQTENITNTFLTEHEVMKVFMVSHYGAALNKSASVSKKMLSDVVHWGNVRGKLSFINYHNFPHL